MAKNLGYINELGKYVRGEDKSMPWDVTTMNKDYEHSMGRKEFAAEITQPHKNGKPSADFIRAYPEYSKEYWSEEVIDKTLREDVGGMI